MRVPRSALANSLTRGVRITAEYSGDGRFFPSWRTRGRTVAAEAPPCSNDERSEGNILYVANSVGKDAADSFKVLESTC